MADWLLVSGSIYGYVLKNIYFFAMTDLTHDKTYRFFMLLFMAVIALSSVLVVLELQKPRVVATLCEHKTGAVSVVYLYYSDGSYSSPVNQSYSCETYFEKKTDGKNYSATTLP